eukprot:gene8004-9403_t
MSTVSSASEEEWDKWYNPNDNDQEGDNEVLYQLLKRARHSIHPNDTEDKSSPNIQFSKYHIDFGLREGEKCKVGVTLKDKIRINNRGSSKVSFSFSNIPVESNNVRLSFQPASGVIKKNSALDVSVEMVVLCTTKVRELVAIDITGGGRHMFTIKIDSKMSQVLDYKEIEIGNGIGGGGYGSIYKSKWRGLSVAVKVISEMSDGSEFEKELEMHKELLHHPNIVHFVGFCVSPKCLVLEYVEGGSLDKYLQDPQMSFSPEIRLKMAYDIAKGMCFLHRNEILHLDLKPQNFLVVSLSLQAPVSIKLADFGLATSSTRSFYGATVEGSFLYMSPEVFTQKKFSRAADVWSYGACLIEILTGKRPYQEYDHVGYLELARVREEGLPPTIPAEIDVEMRKLIESCFLKDHTKRPSFENIEAFLEHRAEDIIRLSQSTSNEPTTAALMALSQSPSSHTLISRSPSASTLATNGRKAPVPNNKPMQVNVPKPNVPPRALNKSSEDQAVVNKLARAMTETAIISDNPRTEAVLPQRSVTISSPTSTPFIVQQPSISPTRKPVSTPPALIPRPSTPVPRPPTPKSNTSPTTPAFSPPVIYNDYDSSGRPINPPTPPPASQKPTSVTIPIPIKNKTLSSASTPKLQSHSSHKPPIRAASAFEIKHESAQTKREQPASSNLASLDLSTKRSITSSFDSDSEMDINKYTELRTRSIRVLKELYKSFTDTIKRFAEIVTLKECIALSQSVRDFKKDLEVLCIEHLNIGWETIHISILSANKRSVFTILPCPHPSHFDGDTFNKVSQLRDVAVSVGESALDGLYYLMSLLSSPNNQYSSSPVASGSPSTHAAQEHFKSPYSDKDTILRIAKLTRAIKLR